MSWKKGTWAGLLLAAALQWPAAGAAAAETGSGITGAEMAGILQDAGYRAKLSTDQDGDPRIETRMSGVNVFVIFYDCKHDRCGSLQFAVALDLEEGSTLQAMNRFNAEYRYTRARLDDEMDPSLHFDFEVLHTARTAHIVSQVDLWEDILGQFLRTTGFNGSDDPDEDDAGDDPAASAG